MINLLYIKFLGILEFPKLEFFLELDIKTTFECDFKDFVDKRIKI
ncbi:MAG: hypothetical protein SPE49_02035 [Campylobacter sp.]|nr:hypothetical protein [Campylobacter sp.]MDY5114741.1 hypothetical protein [Campylobacter sp.]